MIAVIFESWPAPGKMQTYLDMGARLGPQLEKIDGFISIERFQSFSEPGKLLALSILAGTRPLSMPSANGKSIAASRATAGRTCSWDYRLRVAAVLRDYGMNERDQAPADSRMAHG